MEHIIYSSKDPVTTEEIIDLYRSAGINRPIDDSERIHAMYLHSNLIITARYEEQLVGIARSVTDYSYCCYLSDLAVRKEFQSRGIGKMLIERTKEMVGDQSMLLLLSASTAMDYYPKLDMQKVENGFIIRRKY